MKKMRLFLLALTTVATMSFGSPAFGAANKVEASRDCGNEPTVCSQDLGEANEDDSTETRKPIINSDSHYVFGGKERQFLKIQNIDTTDNEWSQTIQVTENAGIYKLQFHIINDVENTVAKDTKIRLVMPDETEPSTEHTIKAIISSSNTEQEEYVSEVTLKSDHEFYIGRHGGHLSLTHYNGFGEASNHIIDGDDYDALFGSGILVGKNLDGNLAGGFRNAQSGTISIYATFDRFECSTKVYRNLRGNELEFRSTYTNAGVSTSKDVSIELNNSSDGLVEIVPDSVMLVDEKGNLQPIEHGAANVPPFFKQMGVQTSNTSFFASIGDYEPGEQVTLIYRVRIVQNVQVVRTMQAARDAKWRRITELIGDYKSPEYCGMFESCTTGNSEGYQHGISNFAEIRLNDDGTFNIEGLPLSPKTMVKRATIISLAGIILVLITGAIILVTRGH